MNPLLHYFNADQKDLKNALDADLNIRFKEVLSVSEEDVFDRNQKDLLEDIRQLSDSLKGTVLDTRPPEKKNLHPDHDPDQAIDAFIEEQIQKNIRQEKKTVKTDLQPPGRKGSDLVEPEREQQTAPLSRKPEKKSAGNTDERAGKNGQYPDIKGTRPEKKTFPKLKTQDRNMAEISNTAPRLKKEARLKKMVVNENTISRVLERYATHKYIALSEQVQTGSGSKTLTKKVGRFTPVKAVKTIQAEKKITTKKQRGLGSDFFEQINYVAPLPATSNGVPDTIKTRIKKKILKQYQRPDPVLLKNLVAVSGDNASTTNPQPENPFSQTGFIENQSIRKAPLKKSGISVGTSVGLESSGTQKKPSVQERFLDSFDPSMASAESQTETRPVTPQRPAPLTSLPEELKTAANWMAEEEVENKLVTLLRRQAKLRGVDLS